MENFQVGNIITIQFVGEEETNIVSIVTKFQHEFDNYYYAWLITHDENHFIHAGGVVFRLVDNQLYFNKGLATVSLVDSIRNGRRFYLIPEISEMPIELSFQQMAGIKTALRSIDGELVDEDLPNAPILLHSNQFGNVNFPSVEYEFILEVDPLFDRTGARRDMNGFTRYFRERYPDKRYLMVLALPGQGKYAYGFNDLEYLQGIITGLGWRNLLPSKLITYFSDNGEPADFYLPG